MTEYHKHYMTIIKELENKVDYQSNHSLEIKRKHSYPQFNSNTASIHQECKKNKISTQFNNKTHNQSQACQSVIEGSQKEIRKTPSKDRFRPRYNKVKALSNNYVRCLKKGLNISEQMGSPYS